MKKTTKIFAFIILILLLLFFWFYYNLENSRMRNEDDNTECINFNKVPKDYILSFHDDKYNNLSNVNIEVILFRKDIEIQKVTIRNLGSKSLIKFKYPFKDFMLTDYLMLNVKDSKYKLNKIEFVNNGKWGAFGYTGGDCELKFQIE